MWLFWGSDRHIGLGHSLHGNPDDGLGLGHYVMFSGFEARNRFTIGRFLPYKL